MNTPECNVYKKCSGCQLLNMSYDQQLTWKQIKVERLMNYYGKVNKIIGMENPYYYRNKVQTLFRMAKSGKIVTGIYQSATNGIVGVESCLLNNKRADRIVIAVKTVVKRLGISIYNPKTGEGFLKNTLVRTAYNTGENMLVLVTADGKFPKKQEFISQLLKLYPKITTIVQNINPNPNKMMLGNKEYVLYGKGKIEDVLCGCKFTISPRSFYQVNPQQTEILYKKAMDMAQLTGTETVIDAYCGTGTIGLIASKYAKNVVGVELNPQAIKDAKENAQLNKRTNIKFFNKDAGAFLEELTQDYIDSPDVLFVDPPRAGCSRVFLNSVVSIKPNKIVYISCDPTTQQRDLMFLTERGYTVKEIQPVDMFPHTNHVETVVLLSREDIDNKI
ncbi:MAG: 23S rRNA (uracil(1939)-C(5))-methyltransferase RlmD [Acutalibacteraceae bacterium]